MFFKHIFQTVFMGFNLLFSGVAAVTSRTPDAFTKTMLQKHNKARAFHHAPPLKWNATMAKAAQKWVNHCKFEHDTRRTWGENLYMVYNYSRLSRHWLASDAVRMWYDEVKTHNWDKPQYSHFTQVVWKNSKQLGCALKYCKVPRAIIISCKYHPPGNYIGQFKQNVLRH